MKRNPVICLLVTGLLIVSLTAQAAAALRMACEGTATCCCRNTAAMPDMTADTAPMGGGCCDIPISQPCDLAGPVSSPTAPFLPTENNIGADISAAFAGMPLAAVVTIDSGVSDRIPIRPPSLAGPPVYLLIQSFLC